MISAHARAGELQEALELFREMLQQQGCAPSPLPDDATFVADEADAGDYVLMSNMYAHEGRHGKAVQVRRQMRRGKVDKVPGCSLIEIDGVVHEFQAVPANSVEISDDASDFFS
ncbi:hypothetical protein VPH35_010622 [Triticum aestivum]|uniref:Pentatricopeptide repeat-containing protein n=1 Tax=Triticum turgidum subsp. durum TaxID=4567 RepID=A0A9R0R548_TRITD|nr:unnamed protein product [Triticum turgidum subsp. durum]